LVRNEEEESPENQVRPRRCT
jgi:hypothetical protein